MIRCMIDENYIKATKCLYSFKKVMKTRERERERERQEKEKEYDSLYD